MAQDQTFPNIPSFWFVLLLPESGPHGLIWNPEFEIWNQGILPARPGFFSCQP